ncbi:MAG: hypothetical protein HY719_11830 [Planctomycetes bacterium]|nr:hypothetical protein [Planctomycetota bacterium]
MRRLRPSIRVFAALVVLFTAGGCSLVNEEYSSFDCTRRFAEWDQDKYDPGRYPEDGAGRVLYGSFVATPLTTLAGYPLALAADTVLLPGTLIQDSVTTLGAFWEDHATIAE